MAAAVACGAAGQAGDLMQDFKAGRLMGLSPRKQILAQMWGIPAGLLGAVPTYALLRSAPHRWGAVPRAGGGGVDGRRAGAHRRRRRRDGLLPPLRLARRRASDRFRADGGSATARAYLARTGGGSDKHPRVLVRLFRAVSSVTATCIPSPTSCGIGCIIPPEASLAAAARRRAGTGPRRTRARTRRTRTSPRRLPAGAGVTGVLTAVAGLATGKAGGE